MTSLTKDKFFALWNVLCDNFRQTRNEFTVAFIYQTLMDRDPDLTLEQFTYAVQQCMVSCTFMPSLNELLRQIYEPDLSGGPAMPDIDPRYADEYQLAAFHKAQHLRNKWEMDRDRVPAVGFFRSDRINEIPGIPNESRRLGFYRRPDRGVLAGGHDLPLVHNDQHQHEMQIEQRKRQMIKQLTEAHGS
jgi:hypothetical protein